MQLTTEVFQRALPKQIRGKVNQDIIDSINSTFKDPILMEQYRDNLLSYTHVMRDGKFRIPQYLEAVKYVGFKLMGNSNIEAYSKTFPARYANYVAQGTSQKDLASYVTSYNKNKLVNLIFEQTIIPTHILNADMYQKAINVQAAIMIDDDVSPKVRSDAANSLLTHLKAPESKVEIDVTIKKDSSLEDLRATTEKLVQQQSKLLIEGVVDARTIAQSSLVTSKGDS
jgi:hypothetical protein